MWGSTKASPGAGIMLARGASATGLTLFSHTEPCHILRRRAHCPRGETESPGTGEVSGRSDTRSWEPRGAAYPR